MNCIIWNPSSRRVMKEVISEDPNKLYELTRWDSGRCEFVYKGHTVGFDQGSVIPLMNIEGNHLLCTKQHVIAILEPLEGTKWWRYHAKEIAEVLDVKYNTILAWYKKKETLKHYKFDKTHL